MNNNRLNQRARLKIVLQGLFAPIALLAILLLAAGRWDYWQGWFFMGLTMAVLVVNLIVLRHRQEVIAERLAPGEGQKTWDKIYFAVTTPLFFVTMLIGGLDAGRYGWSPKFSWWVYVLSTLVYLFGQVIFLWAKRTNRFFSAVVRIQKDRGQKVCQEGPYKYVRHPGYIGGIFFTILTPILLGSLWGLIPQGIVIVYMIVRTKLEDDTLKKELPGYVEFAKKVKYRLVPGIW
jgi:protein-S-isoprenylcysteine O-methyltransferase Ste14